MTTPPLDNDAIQRTLDVYAAQKGSPSKAARILGCAVSTVTYHVREAKKRGLKSNGTAPASPRRRSKADARAEFRAKHDPGFIIPQKIAAALRGLGEDWQYEADFFKVAGVNPTQAAPYKDQFADHHFVVTTDGRKRAIWCGSKTFAAELRADLQR